MALRSSRASSSSALLSKFKAAAKSAEAFQTSDMAYQYNQGLITSEEYLSFLKGKDSGLTKGTSEWLTNKKKLDNVELDIKQNRLESEIKLGTKDPSLMVPVLKQRIFDNDIQEGTPLYNQIVESIVAFNDKSVDYAKKIKEVEYNRMKEIDASSADQQWQEYLDTLPDQYTSAIRKEDAQIEADNFRITKFKNDTKREIENTRRDLLAMGADSIESKKIMVDKYAEMYNKANEAGLGELAADLLSNYYSTADSLRTSLEAEAKKGNSNAVKIINEEAQSAKTALDYADKADTEGYAAAFKNRVNSLIALKNAKLASGDTTTVDSVDNELRRMGVDPNTGEYLSDVEIAKAVAEGNADEGLKTMFAMTNLVDPDSPQVGQYVLTNDNGKTSYKRIESIDKKSDGSSDIHFQGEMSDTGETNYVQNPQDGIAYRIVKNTTGNNNDYYVVTGKNESGQEIRQRVGMNGNDAVLIGQDMGNGVYRSKSTDGGYNFYKYDDKNTVEEISYQDASVTANKTIKDMLDGSERDSDKKVLESMVANQVYDKKMDDIIANLTGQYKIAVNKGIENATNIAQGAVNKIEEENKQKGIDVARAKEIQAQADAQINGSFNPTPEFKVPQVTKDLRTQVRASQGLPATPMKEPLGGWADVTGKGAAAGFVGPNALLSGKRQEIAPGYYRVTKSDGGFDFVKGDNFKLSAEDLAKETGKNVNEVKDPNKQYKWIN